MYKVLLSTAVLAHKVVGKLESNSAVVGDASVNQVREISKVVDLPSESNSLHIANYQKSKKRIAGMFKELLGTNDINFNQFSDILAGELSRCQKATIKSQRLFESGKVSGFNKFFKTTTDFCAKSGIFGSLDFLIAECRKQMGIFRDSEIDFFYELFNCLIGELDVASGIVQREAVVKLKSSLEKMDLSCGDLFKYGNVDVYNILCDSKSFFITLAQDLNNFKSYFQLITDGCTPLAEKGSFEQPSQKKSLFCNAINIFNLLSSVIEFFISFENLKAPSGLGVDYPLLPDEISDALLDLTACLFIFAIGDHSEYFQQKQHFLSCKNLNWWISTGIIKTIPLSEFGILNEDGLDKWIDLQCSFISAYACNVEIKTESSLKSDYDDFLQRLANIKATLDLVDNKLRKSYLVSFIDTFTAIVKSPLNQSETSENEDSVEYVNIYPVLTGFVELDCDLPDKTKEDYEEVVDSSSESKSLEEHGTSKETEYIGSSSESAVEVIGQIDGTEVDQGEKNKNISTSLTAGNDVPSDFFAPNPRQRNNQHDNIDTSPHADFESQNLQESNYDRICRTSDSSHYEHYSSEDFYHFFASKHYLMRAMRLCLLLLFLIILLEFLAL